MLFGSSFIFLGQVPQVHAQITGEICLAEIGSAKCPATGPVFNGPVSVPATQLKIAVFINSSAGLNGFDITLLSDHNFLKPADADLTGTILPGSPTLLSKCIGGVNRTVAPCPSYDTADTLQLAAVGGLAQSTVAPTTGLLFTATYNISQTATAPISIGFQTGCSTSSVAGPTKVCATITNGVIIPDPETVQSASFNNASPPPWISISSNANTIGPLAPGTSSTATIKTSGQNGWPSGFSPDSITFSHQETPGLLVVFPTSCSPAICSVTLRVSSTSEGNYSVTILGEYSTYDPNPGVYDNLVATITLHVQVQAFAISLSGTNISFVSGSTNSTTVNLSFGAGFTGTVSLATSISPTIGLTASCSSLSITVGSPSSTCSFQSSTPGNYNVTITATSGSFSHSANSTVRVLPVTQTTPGPSGVFGLQPLQLWGIISGAAVAAVVAFLFFRRRRKGAA